MPTSSSHDLLGTSHLWATPPSSHDYTSDSDSLGSFSDSNSDSINEALTDDDDHADKTRTPRRVERARDSLYESLLCTWAILAKPRKHSCDDEDDDDDELGTKLIWQKTSARIGATSLLGEIKDPWKSLGQGLKGLQSAVEEPRCMDIRSFRQCLGESSTTRPSSLTCRSSNLHDGSQDPAKDQKSSVYS